MLHLRRAAPSAAGAGPTRSGRCRRCCSPAARRAGGRAGRARACSGSTSAPSRRDAPPRARRAARRRRAAAATAGAPPSSPSTSSTCTRAERPPGDRAVDRQRPALLARAGRAAASSARLLVVDQPHPRRRRARGAPRPRAASRGSSSGAIRCEPRSTASSARRVRRGQVGRHRCDPPTSPCPDRSPRPARTGPSPRRRDRRPRRRPDDVPGARPVREEDALDVDEVAGWVARAVPGLDGAPEVLQFSGGASNLTYLLRYPGRDLVLRRPPAGHEAGGAHDMAPRVRRAAPAAPALPARAARARRTTARARTATSWSTCPG